MASSDILQVHFVNTLPLKGIQSVFSRAYMYMPPKYPYGNAVAQLVEC